MDVNTEEPAFREEEGKAPYPVRFNDIEALCGEIGGKRLPR